MLGDVLDAENTEVNSPSSCPQGAYTLYRCFIFSCFLNLINFYKLFFVPLDNFHRTCIMLLYYMVFT